MEMPQASGNKMQVDDRASDHSSSSISSPPTSPQNTGFSDTIRVAQLPYSSHPRLSGGGVVNAASATAAQSAIPSTHAVNGNTSTKANASINGTAPEKPKRQRKKKEVGQDGKPVADDKPKEKKPRKPRAPKDQTAGANGDKPAAPRKKQKTEEKTNPHDASAQSRQPTITEMVGTFQPPNQPASTTMPPQPQHRTSDNMIRTNIPHQTSNPSTPRPFSSGQNYDPIRGATIESAPSRPSNPPNGINAAHTSPHVNRASASPAIAGLIDPPVAPKVSRPPDSFSSQQALQQTFVSSQQQSPPPSNTATFTAPPPPQASPSQSIAKPAAISNMDGAMDVEPTCELPKDHPLEIKVQSKSSSSAPTPKAARPTPPPPKGTGSGLLSSSDLFGGPSAGEPTERKGVNIDLQIPLNPRGGNTINIAQEIVKKYGRDAINPRAAAHRDQLLRIAAEQNRLEHGSNDEMSVDLMSELEGDSNVEMGGMDDEKSNTGAEGDAKPARKRRKKVEEYDKEDDFIDDTELAWQEQAAVAKDGFFVYSGPLVPKGQQAQVESATSTRGSRGGRSRARGSRTVTSGSTHASLKEKSSDPNSTSTSTRGRTRGSRGAAAPRKPRITKADRERMDAEKVDRERVAQGMGGPTGAPIALAPTPTPGPQPPQQQHQQSYAQQPMGTMV